MSNAETLRHPTADGLPEICDLCTRRSRNGRIHGRSEACMGFVQWQGVGETGGIVLVAKPCRCICRTPSRVLVNGGTIARAYLGEAS